MSKFPPPLAYWTTLSVQQLSDTRAAVRAVLRHQGKMVSGWDTPNAERRVVTLHLEFSRMEASPLSLDELVD